METYREMHARHQSEINALPLKFAFGIEQFKRMCDSWGFTVDEAPSMIYHGGAGMYYLRKDSALIRDTFKRCNDEEYNAIISNFDFAVEAFEYEMYNHEYSYTMDAEEVIDSIGLEWADFEAFPMLVDAFKKAEANILKQEGE